MQASRCVRRDQGYSAALSRRSSIQPKIDSAGTTSRSGTLVLRAEALVTAALSTRPAKLRGSMNDDMQIHLQRMWRGLSVRDPERGRSR